MADKTEEWYRKVYEAHKTKVYNLALSMLQKVEEAEEITQDVFIEVFRKYDSFEGKSALNTWIYRITTNRCLDHIKSKRRKKRFAWITNIFDPETGNIIYDQPDFNHPGVLLENKESTATLFKHIENLPDNQKSVILLTKLEGLSNEETAKVLNTSISSVESLLFRARQNLKKLIGTSNKK